MCVAKICSEKLVNNIFIVVDYDASGRRTRNPSQSKQCLHSLILSALYIRLERRTCVGNKVVYRSRRLESIRPRVKKNREIK